MIKSALLILCGMLPLIFHAFGHSAMNYEGYEDRRKENERKGNARDSGLAKALTKVNTANVEATDFDLSSLYAATKDSKPRVQQEFTVYMGDIMVQQRVGYYAECLTPTKSLSAKTGPQRYWAEANVPACKKKKDDKHYTAPYINFDGSQPGSKQSLNVSMRTKKKGDQFCWHFGPFKKCTDYLSSSDLKVGYGFVSYEGVKQQTIEYAGKNGNVVKFIYTEFVDDMIRDAFTREFQIDLEEGPVAAYKGMVFEVSEASNAQITYKVIRHFR